MTAVPAPATTPLRIAFVAAEVAPFAKTGGLADVSAALPRHLHGAGHDVRLVMPMHGTIDREADTFTRVGFLRDVRVRLGAHTFSFDGWAAKLPDSDLDVYFIDCPPLFRRQSVYTNDGDEHLRFAFLCRAAFAIFQHMGFAPDVLHANDWHTALMPLFRRTHYHWDRLFQRTRTVLTIHNIAYQGVFPSSVLGDLDLGGHEGLLSQDDLRDGMIGFLKTGLLHADAVTTVSETYAEEIQTPAYGVGLDPVLRRRRGAVFGIVNGIDDAIWNPRSDPALPRRYGPDDVAEGKAENKTALLAELGLEPTTHAPLFGIVSRLTAQKGFELLDRPLAAMLRHHDVRVAVLGTGEPGLEGYFQGLQNAFPGKVCFYRGYSERLAHWIEAAADFFVMPSRFEPCGLNQMYSLAYGTVPIVRRTGGLADTVRLYEPATGEGTGVVFDHFDDTAMGWALERALALYHDGESLPRLRRNAMAQDFSWRRQGARYERLYRTLVGS